MQEDLFSCSVCLLEFDGQAHLPKLIPTCGHTLCLTCLTDMINTKRECPQDRKKFPKLLKKNEDFPTNLLALQAIDIRLNGNYETCNQHGKPKHLFCFVDRIQICEECRQNHEGHDIKSVKELKDKAQAQKKKLESLIDGFTSRKEEAEASIEDFRKSAATILERGFKKAKEILKQREKEIFNQIDSFLETKEEEIEKAIEEDGLLKEKYEIKIADLNDLSSSQRFFRTLDKLEKKKAQDFKIDHVLNDLELIKGQYMPVLETQTDSLVSSIEKLNFDILANIPVSVKEIGGLKVDISNLEPLLEMKIQGNQLLITPRNCTSRSSRPPLDLSLWNDITWFEVQFDKGRFTMKHFQALKKIYSHCVNITAFCLRAKNENFIDEHLTCFVSDPFWATNKIQELWLDLQVSQVSDRGLVKLIRESLVKMLQVKKFNLIPNKEIITDKSVLALATYFIPKVINLETFNHQVYGPQITDFSVVELFKSLLRLMDDIKVFTLNLNKTKITDESFIVFSQENLKKSTNLESLNLFLSRTQITDHGLEIFCEEAKNKLHRIKRFSLDLRGTQITDQSISAFGNQVLPNMASLNALIVWIPISATDSSVQSLCGGLGKIINNLEEFQLVIVNSRISEDGIQMITRLFNVKSLPRLRAFDLVFHGISVDDLTRGQINHIKNQLSIRNNED